MADSKHRFPGPAQPNTEPQAERRRLSRVVHDHKGNATVQWYDAPADYERTVLEIEGAREPATRHKSGTTTRTDLRKLSAWIKMMRSLEEAKKRRNEDDD
jgi:hypothetical protein